MERTGPSEKDLPVYVSTDGATPQLCRSLSEARHAGSTHWISAILPPPPPKHLTQKEKEQKAADEYTEGLDVFKQSTARAGFHAGILYAHRETDALIERMLNEPDSGMHYGEAIKELRARLSP